MLLENVEWNSFLTLTKGSFPLRNHLFWYTDWYEMMHISDTHLALKHFWYSHSSYALYYKGSFAELGVRNASFTKILRKYEMNDH